MIQTFTKVDNLIRRFGLQPGFALQAKSRGWSMLKYEHYAIYWGQDANGGHLFIANLPSMEAITPYTGVQSLNERQMEKLYQRYHLTDIERCGDSTNCDTSSANNSAVYLIVKRTYSSRYDIRTVSSRLTLTRRLATVTRCSAASFRSATEPRTT